MQQEALEILGFFFHLRMPDTRYKVARVPGA